MTPTTLSRSRRTLPLLALLAAASLSPLAPTRAAAQDLTDARRISIAEALSTSTVSVLIGHGSGSGFVATTEGWVVTNAHVVQGSRGVARVRFANGQTLPARVLAVDTAHDLAVLDPEGPTPAPLTLGDADTVRVGQTVLAFGSPYGLDGTLTQGIVSARRDLPAGRGGQMEGVIQTDATINPGNSGGPLVNTRGEVIGVNTAILSRSGGSQGIGFAVPVDYVKDLIQQLRASSQVASANPRGREQAPAQAAPPTRPAPAGNAPEVWLGVYAVDVRGGVQIERVVPGAAAARAGLLGRQDPMPRFVSQMGVPWTGHIILAVEGRRVRSLAELQHALDGRRPGEQVRLLVAVGNGELSGETVVQLEPRPAAP